MAITGKGHIELTSECVLCRGGRTFFACHCELDGIAPDATESVHYHTASEPRN